jgi:hypothetical protein
MDRSAHPANVTARTRHSVRIKVRSMQFKPWHPERDENTRSAGSTAEINNDAGRPLRDLSQQRQSLVDQELGAAARDKDTGVKLNPQAPELRPAENVLERIARNALLNSGSDVRRSGGRGQEKAGLLLGKDTPCGTQTPGDHGNGIGIGLINAAGA